MSHSAFPVPASFGFRMPAEWEPQEAVWFSWPHNVDTWPGAFPSVPPVFAEIVREISESQRVRINVGDESMAEQARSLLKQHGADLSNVAFHPNPTNDCWARDHGPLYVVRDEHGVRERALIDWGYNSWGEKYPPYDLDNGIPRRISNEFGEFAFEGGMILEGGSIDVNGTGSLLTTTSCLLNPNRNPQLNRAQIESRLRDYLGVENILWLEDGILGDDTDGHIDDITRFVSSTTIVTAIEDDPHDDNHLPLQKNLQLLKQMTNEQGQSFDIVKLPMPQPVYFDNHRLPASYANFLITNDKVLVPTYRCDRDQAALEILKEQFPTRQIVGIDCTHLVWGLGAIHCISQQQPRADRLWIPVSPI